MVALAPSFNIVHRRFVEELLADGDDLRLPPGMRLRVALTRDSHVRVASAYHSYRVLGARQDYEAFAEIYFYPFVWLLTGETTANGTSLPDQEQWGDASDWITFTRDAYRTDLRDVLRGLPSTIHPSRRSETAEDWFELGGPTSYVLEGAVLQ